MTLDATPAIGHLEVIDGYEAGLLAQTARDCFENPERFGASLGQPPLGRW